MLGGWRYALAGWREHPAQGLRHTGTPNCNLGGLAEVKLAHRASKRLLEILNGNEWTIERFGLDGTRSERRLATIRVDGRDVGDILIEEGLARRWPHGREFWCR
jgi:micrococcal nuclease